MQPSNFCIQASDALKQGYSVIPDPGTGNVIAQLSRMQFAIGKGWGAGTYILPNLAEGGGCVFYAIADGAQVYTNVTGTTIGTLASGEAAIFVSTTTSGWSGTILAASASVEINTAADVPIADAGAYTAKEDVETALQEIYAGLAAATPINTTYNNTDATGTLAAAAIVGGLITRTGETSAYTDTTATGAQIKTALGTGINDDSGHYTWLLFIRNTVAFTQTLAAGTDVTLSGNSVIPANSVGVFIVDVDGGQSTVEIIGTHAARTCSLPNGQYNTSAAASPVTAAAGVLTGADHVYWRNTTDGAFSLTTRTAAQMFGDIPNCQIGYKYFLTILQEGDNTITITPGSNVTIDVATIATTVARTYMVNFTSATACTLTTVHLGTSP